MANTPEGKVKDKIKKILEKHDIYYAMPHGAGFGNTGTPDFLCCMKGKFLAIEAKADASKEPTALQHHHLQMIEYAGGNSWIVHAGNIHMFEVWVKENS